MADAGLYATARRGGLLPEERHEIRAHRAGPRPTPYQALAKRYGVSEADIRAVAPLVEPRAEPKDSGPVHISVPLANVLRNMADAAADPAMADSLRALADETAAKA